MAITLEAIRAAGGIVHSDGNIFFRDISMLQGLAGAAPAAVAPRGAKFFSASNEGLDEHDTAEAAQNEAQSIIDMYREEAADGWPEEVESVCWGVILGKAVERPVEDAPFMAGILGSDMEPVDYVLEPVAAPALEAPAVEERNSQGDLQAAGAAIRAALAAAPQAPAAPVAPAATVFHDAGAIAQCTCGRYTLNRNSLSPRDERRPVCECGTNHGWSGSFKKPGADSKWHGPAPAPAAAPAAPAVDASTVADMARALEMLVGSDALHSLCEHEGIDAIGRVKGTWSKAAECNARSTLLIHRKAIDAAIAAQAKEGGEPA